MDINQSTNIQLENYFLLRNKYEQIIKSYEYLIQMYKEVEEIEYITGINNQYIMLFLNEKIQETKLIKNFYDEQIYKLCNHNFIEDTIDIHPEKSINIKYCKICEYTEK